MKKLYYIENRGCDDTTHGIAEFDDSEFEVFKQTIKNLNKNSTYGCMPVIRVYKISWDELREYVEEDEGDDNYYEMLYFGGRVYTWKDIESKSLGSNLMV